MVCQVCIICEKLATQDKFNNGECNIIRMWAKYACSKEQMSLFCWALRHGPRPYIELVTTKDLYESRRVNELSIPLQQHDVDQCIRLYTQNIHKPKGHVLHSQYSGSAIQLISFCICSYLQFRSVVNECTNGS